MDQPESLVYEEVIRRFNQALSSFMEAERTLIRLKYEQELSRRELATRSGLSLSAVKLRLKRSREKIQRYYANLLTD